MKAPTIGSTIVVFFKFAGKPREFFGIYRVSTVNKSAYGFTINHGDGKSGVFVSNTTWPYVTLGRIGALLWSGSV